MRKTIDMGGMTVLLGLSSAMLAGCGSRDDEAQVAGASGDWQVCTDAQGRRVEDDECRSNRNGYRGGYGGGHAWFYVRRSAGSVPAIGESVIGGRSAPSGPVAFAPSQGVSRGGFGATGARFSPRA